MPKGMIGVPHLQIPKVGSSLRGLVSAGGHCAPPASLESGRL